MRCAFLLCTLLLAACAAPPREPVAKIVATPLTTDFAPGKPSVRAQTKAAPLGDILHGSYETWWPNGNRAAAGSYREGRRDGQWLTWYENGNPECEARYENDQLTGAWRTWHENGVLKEQGQYASGSRHGRWEAFDSAGVWTERVDFYFGEVTKRVRGPGLVELERHYVDGFARVRMTGRWINGEKFIRDGAYRAWHENGALAAEATFKNDKPANTRREWHENGKPSLETAFDDDGRQHGRWAIWRVDGQLLEKVTYVHGLREGPWYQRTADNVRVYGHYRNGLLHGPYLEQTPEGQPLVIGNYEDGEPAGNWFHTGPRGMKLVPQLPAKVDERYSNGQVRARGERVDGRRSGTWNYYYESGELALVAAFAYDRLHGTARSFHKNGKVWRQADYEKGKRKGPASEWDEYGLTELSGEWNFAGSLGQWELRDWMGNHLKSYQRNNGKWRQKEEPQAALRACETRHENGAIESRYFGYELREARYCHGAFKRYFKDGTLCVDGQYEDNVATGEWAYYYPNGKLFARGDYINGDRTGLWVFYHDNGQIAQRGRFGCPWEKPHELIPLEAPTTAREPWDLELDWRGYLPAFAEKQEAWLSYDLNGEVSERRYFTPSKR